MDFDKDTWSIIHNYYESHPYYLTMHHLDSYNDFLQNKIPQTLKQLNPQIHYKKKLTDGGYQYRTEVYFGGIDGDKIYLDKPIIHKDIDGKITKKLMYPNEARLRNLTYASHIFCDIEIHYFIKTDNGEEEQINKHFEKVPLGKIPIMLHSKACVLKDTPFELRRQMGECPYDQGGYFIIDGAEKVIVSHERKAENKLYIVKSNDDDYNYSAQIKSVPEDSFTFARTSVVNINHENIITVRMPLLDFQIPLFVMFHALGFQSDKEILEMILLELESDEAKMIIHFINDSLLDSRPIYDQEPALKYLANAAGSMLNIMSLIRTDLFPHVGNDYRDKALYLGYVVKKLINVTLGIENVTDRDSFAFKRVDLSGFLMANLFREAYKQFQRDSGIAIDTLYRFNASQYKDEKYADIINGDNLGKIFSPLVIETTIQKAFKIGTILNKVGLIQEMNRLSSLGTISHLRRVNTTGDMIMIGQRKLHSTQFGIICPVETPDGGSIGIKKHLSSMAHVTFGCSGKPLIELSFELGVKAIQGLLPKHMAYEVKVFVNGRWIGIHTEPTQFVTILRYYRRNALINIFTSISWNIPMNEIHILTDGGRCARPLYILDDKIKPIMDDKKLQKVKNGEMDWFSLLQGTHRTHKTKLDYYDCERLCPPIKDIQKGNYDLNKLKKHMGCIEYLDVDEMIYNLLANNTHEIEQNKLPYSHMELHPSLVLGPIGYTIPYCNRSQAPRNVYGTSQSKQSVGLYVSNFRNRFDTSAHVLYYPQKPLINTRLSKYSMTESLPTGMNAIVAVGCYTGYNQEDSIIFNKSSLERGLFRSCYFKKYEGMEITDKKGGTQDVFFNPNNKNNANDIDLIKDYNYSNLDENGFITEGLYVNEKDVLISKYTSVETPNEIQKKDSSIVVKKGGSGVIDKVFCDYSNSYKERLCKVRVVTTRQPMLGDKFASRHGQKGVLGMVFEEKDMPFTKDGIIPDMIINPHAFPSRMTIGQFLESFTGKLCCEYGFFSDGTPFTDVNKKEIGDILEQKAKYSRYGDEILYSGINGKQLDTQIFIGPTYYQRLKHMVADKVNSRDTGKITLKNRQPPSGKRAGGGLRIGEMERDALLSHGALQFVKESFMERSDKFTGYISENSGQFSVYNPDLNRYLCPNIDGPLEFEGDTQSTIKMTTKNSNITDIIPVYIPYNMKTLIQECEAMSISPRIITSGMKQRETLTIKGSGTFIPQDIDKRKHKQSGHKQSKHKHKHKQGHKNFQIGDEVHFRNERAIILSYLERNNMKIRIIATNNEMREGNIFNTHERNLTKLGENTEKTNLPTINQQPDFEFKMAGKEKEDEEQEQEEQEEEQEESGQGQELNLDLEEVNIY